MCSTIQEKSSTRRPLSQPPPSSASVFSCRDQPRGIWECTIHMLMSAVAEPSANVRVALEADERDARLRAMVDACYATVWRALRRLGVAKADAEDAAQEVF